MSTRSLIGTFDADDTHYRARYCHNNGYPAYQVCQIGRALHAYHGRDVAAFTRTVLRQDWSALAPDEASETLAENRSASPHDHRPVHVRPMLGVGYYYIDVPPGEPITGTIDEQPDRDYEWLYLFTHDQRTLCVYANNTAPSLVPQWTLAYCHPVSDLDGHDPTLIIAA